MTAQKPKSIREAYLQASSLFKQHGVDEAEQQAEWLILAATGMDRTSFFLNWQESIEDDAWQQLLSMIQRRMDGEPVQYITREQEFYGLQFTVTPDVLIPRPETELLVEAVAKQGKRLSDKLSLAGIKAADIGTGSGAIAVTLAHLRPEWHITASDLSSNALDIARMNAKRHHVESRIKFMQGDLLNPLIDQRLVVDIVVSNPPYIEKTVIPTLQKEVRDHEPWLALDGGEDGLVPYRRMLEQFRRLPRMPYIIGFEVGQGQAPSVRTMLKSLEWYTHTQIIHDLAGIERHVLAWNEANA